MSIDTDYAYSYEYAVDINLGTSAVPDWQTIRFSSAINPETTDISKDGQTYDDNGAPHPVKTSESWKLGFTVQAHRLQDGSGEFLPEVEALLAACGPEAVGTNATREFRWYDDPVDQDPNPNEAYQGTGKVSMTRQTTGNDDLAGWAFTVEGQGRRTRIANPSTATSASGAPVIASVLPAGQAAGELVTITGSGFTGATAVTFDAIAADEFVVVSPTTIVASLPADASGTVPVVVTNAVGASAAVNYTRA